MKFQQLLRVLFVVVVENSRFDPPLLEELPVTMRTVRKIHYRLFLLLVEEVHVPSHGEVEAGDLVMDVGVVQSSETWHPIGRGGVAPVEHGVVETRALATNGV